MMFVAAPPTNGVECSQLLQSTTCAHLKFEGRLPSTKQESQEMGPQKSCSPVDAGNVISMHMEGSGASGASPSDQGQEEAFSAPSTSDQAFSELLAERVELAQRWLVFAHHCSTCSKTNCPESRCRSGKLLLQHTSTCINKGSCGVPRCQFVSALLAHHFKCKSPTCPVCVPVKGYLSSSGVRRASVSQE